MILAETVAHLHRTVWWYFGTLLVVNAALYLLLIWLIVSKDKDKDKDK